MKRILSVFLGVLTAIGGFVDIGDLVANALAGARFGLSLVWVTVLGVVGICLFAEMSGRVAAVTRRGTLDPIRERLRAPAGALHPVPPPPGTGLAFTPQIRGGGPPPRPSPPPH